MKGMGFRLVRLASWRTLLVMALTMGVLGMQSGRGTLAYFTDSVASTGNTLTAGNLKMKLNGSTGTGTITFTPATTYYKPGSQVYGYVALENTGADAVSATVKSTITRTSPVSGGQGNTCTDATTSNACLDSRLKFEVQSYATDPTPAGCSAWTGTNVTLTNPTGTVDPTTSRTVLAQGSALPFIQDGTISFAGGDEFKYYCVRVTWPSDTSGSLDNPAKQAVDTYVLTFNAQSN
jgi:predicted ribosomally synthesized peptide with SipW-like signal peptide